MLQQSPILLLQPLNPQLHPSLIHNPEHQFEHDDDFEWGDFAEVVLGEQGFLGEGEDVEGVLAEFVLEGFDGGDGGGVGVGEGEEVERVEGEGELVQHVEVLVRGEGEGEVLGVGEEMGAPVVEGLHQALASAHR